MKNMFKKIYALVLISIILLIVTILISSTSAYTIKLPLCNGTISTFCLPLCNGTISTSCINFNDTIGTTNSGTSAIIFYQNGNIYISNDTPANYTINYYNLTNIINSTNVTYVYPITNYYVNLSNGSTYFIQDNKTTINYTINYTINNDYIRDLFQQVYVASNWSNFYNKTYIDLNFETIGDINSVKTTLSTYVTKTDLAAFDARIASLNNINGFNWTDFNMTRMNEISDSGAFSMFWKVIIIIEGIIIVLLLAFVVKSMSSGGDY